MGAPSITYESPKIEKDDTFEKYLQYQQDRELRLDERAQAATDRSAAAERRRREGGARGFQDYAENIKRRYSVGALGAGQAQDMLQDYISDYSLDQGFLPATQTRTRTVYDDVLDDEGKATGERTPRQEEYEYTNPGATPGFEFNQDLLGQFKKELSDLELGYIDPATGEQVQGLRDKRFSAGVSKAYQDLFGREVTDEELTKAMQEFSDGIYKGGAADFRANLKESEAYQKKFNDNYMDNYYDMFYGSSVAERTDAEGNVSKLRKYSYDESMLPTFTSADAEEGETTASILERKTGITLPDYKEYFSKARSVGELEDQRQAIAQTKDFIYSAGLKELQGNIDKEMTKLSIEGRKDIAKIDQATQMYKLINFQF
jgi:hypothetical protein